MDLIESYKEELKLIRKPWTRVWVGALLLALLLLPWYGPEHFIYIATIIWIYTIGVLGQNILSDTPGRYPSRMPGFWLSERSLSGTWPVWGFPGP
jgi:hypothetical protein